MEYASCMGRYLFLIQCIQDFREGFLCVLVLFVVVQFCLSVLVLFYFKSVYLFYFTVVYTDSREKDVHVSWLLHFPDCLVLQKFISFLHLHYFTTTSLLPYFQTSYFQKIKGIYQLCSQLLRKMSETEWRGMQGAKWSLLCFPAAALLWRVFNLSR